MVFCLYCYDEITTSSSWKYLFYMNGQSRICQQCTAQLVEVSRQHCFYCHKESEMECCEDCLKWYDLYKGHDPLKRNVSIYQYNDIMKEMVAKWKYRGDFVIGNMFAPKVLEVFKQEFSISNEHDFIIIPIPLSDKRLYERNFNQAKQLASFLPGSMDESLVRIHTEKQSKKSRYERLQTVNPFRLQNKIKRNVILVDDIYTTGQTIRHAATLLKMNGCNNVYSFTLIRG